MHSTWQQTLATSTPMSQLTTRANLEGVQVSQQAREHRPGLQQSSLLLVHGGLAGVALLDLAPDAYCSFPGGLRGQNPAQQSPSRL